MDMLDGTFTFGSRWSGGIVSPRNGGNWFDRVKVGDIQIDDLRGTLSRVYAFDQFIHNVDRHANNFMAHDQHDGYALLANDYSRAWVRHGVPLPPLPLPNCNTVGAQRWLAEYWTAEFIEPGYCDEVIERLRQMPTQVIENIINDHPEDWLPHLTRSAIIAWGSTEMLARLDGISKGIKDGTYL